jgi:ribosome biogenesis GTPase / thiamine phosphate phosphatase
MVVSHLHELGWNSFFQQYLKEGDSRIPARIVEQQRSAYRVACEAAELMAETAGHLRYTAVERSGLPVVGDWVLIEARFAEGRATIHEVLPRKSKFSRKAAGQETTEQVAAANVDTVFLMTSLNADLNTRRVERYLTTIWNSGAQPVILLSKADLCDDVMPAIEAVAEVAFGVPIHALSSTTGEGVDQLHEYLKPGRTVALLGSSGVGKSTLINRLLGHEVQTVREIREDDARGRHTTTARRLFLLPGGGMLIDTPGMRELQLWDASEGLSQTFNDIDRLAEECRFRDCGHQSEPGCAVQSALAKNEISAERFESYLKLRRELQHLERKQDVLARIEQTRRWKRIHKAVRDMYKHRDKP